MRKNKMMRTAAVLGVAALLTTSALSGTLAKYTTTSEAQDSARVAKWGVTITMASDDSAFKSTYDKQDSSTNTSITSSVEAKTEGGTQDKVVAPGTSGETTFSIAGTPEVAFRLDVAVANNTSTVHLDANQEYELAAGEFADDVVKVKLSEKYEPIKFTLSQKSSGDTYTVMKKSNDNTIEAKDMTLSELKTELEALSKDYEANKSVDAEYKIAWVWDYSTTFDKYSTGDGLKGYNDADVLDTYLGNEKNAQKETYKITITATQID